MKAKIGLTHFWVLLLIFLLNGCMPDSMTKWEENPPKKDEAPVVVYDPPANYSYSVALGGQTSKIFDVNETITPLAPNENFIGEEVTFSVAPTLPKGLSLNSTTGVISGTPIQETGAQLYTFTATNSGGTSTTTITFDVVTPTTLGALTYGQFTLPVNYLKLDEVLDTIGPTLEDGTSSSWSITPNNGSIGTCTSPKVQILPGVCFDTTSGVITGTPTATMLDSVTFTVTAAKTDPVSTSSVSFNLQVLEAPAGLTYEQSSLLKINLNTSDPSLVYDRYIKIVNAGGTSCTLAYIEDSDGSSLLVRKHDPSYTYSLGDYVTQVATQLYDSTSITCNLLDNDDLGGTIGPIGNIPISSIANVFQKGEKFELNPTLTSGAPHEDKIEFSISSSTVAITPNTIGDGYTLPGDIEDFYSTTGSFKGSLNEDYEPTEYTITAKNGVGETTYVLKVSPIVQIPKYINYSQQITMRVNDASAFEVGEEISSISYTDPQTNEVLGAGRGKILSIETDPVTFGEIMVVSLDENTFHNDLPVDDRYPYNSEETTIGGYVKLTVANASSFRPGEYITSENAAFGIVYDSSATTISVKVLNGQFSKAENIDDSYPYTAAETQIIEATEDGVLDGHTAVLTVITTNTPMTLNDLILPATGKEITSGLVNVGRITYVPHSYTAKVKLVASLSAANLAAALGSPISISNLQGIGGVTHENIGQVARAATSDQIYITDLKYPLQKDDYIQYQDTFTGTGVNDRILSAINNHYIVKIQLPDADSTIKFEVGDSISTDSYNNVGKIYHIDRDKSVLYVKEVGARFAVTDLLSPGETYDVGNSSSITSLAYGYRVYMKQTKGSFSIGDTVTISGASSGVISVIEAANYQTIIDTNSSSVTIKSGLSYAEARNPITKVGQSIRLFVNDNSGFRTDDFISSSSGGEGRVQGLYGTRFIYVLVTKDGFAANDNLDDASTYVGPAVAIIDNFTDPDILPVTDPRVTGDINGYINSYNSITGYSYITAGNSIPFVNMDFDYLNPINQFRVNYPRFSTLSTTASFFLRKGVPITLSNSIDRDISASFSITPMLPEGLTFDGKTGMISGTPTKASTFKSYTVEAINSSYPDDPVYFSFNLQIDEFFELQVDRAADSGSPSYILHRSGKEKNSSRCRITMDQVKTANYEDVDVLCRLEAGELDLYQLGAKFSAVAGPGMCNHIQIEPYYYYEAPYLGKSSPTNNNVYSITTSPDCSPVEDTDHDGRIDFLIANDAGTGVCDGLGGVGAGTDFDDGDGDGDCSIETTPSTEETIVNNLVTDGFLPIGILPAENETTLSCKSNFSEKYMCDDGSITVHTVTFAPVTADSNFCGLTISDQETSCGGKISNCIGGALYPEISIDNINKGKRSIISATKVGTISTATFATPVPINVPLFSNRYLADYSLNHPFFFVPEREIDYSFDIINYLAFFENGYLGTGDPVSRTHPFYTFSCLDEAEDPIARIHVQVRDWDTGFDINSPIDSNHIRRPIRDTSSASLLTFAPASTGDYSITLTGNVPTNSDGDLVIQPGSIIRLGTHLDGEQSYVVYSVAGSVINLVYPLVNDYAAGIDVIYTPFTSIDSNGKVVETMDTDSMVNPLFNTDLNNKGDMDNLVTIGDSDIDKLSRPSNITTTKISDELPALQDIEIGHFDENGDWVVDQGNLAVADTLEVAVVTGRVLTISAATSTKYYSHYHYVRKLMVNGTDYIYYRISDVDNGETEITVAPLTRPFRQETSD